MRPQIFDLAGRIHPVRLPGATGSVSL